LILLNNKPTTLVTKKISCALQHTPWKVVVNLSYQWTNKQLVIRGQYKLIMAVSILQKESRKLRLFGTIERALFKTSQRDYNDWSFTKNTTYAARYNFNYLLNLSPKFYKKRSA